MKDSKIDLILHPVRMRIIQSLINRRHLTVQQISELLPEVPQATLYRHLKKLLNSDILTVVDENQVRGVVERVYSLAEHSGQILSEEVEQATPEEHYQYFFTFLTNLLADFEQYLQQDQLDFKADGVGYRQASVFLTDDEFAELMGMIGSALLKAAEKGPAPGRKRRTITTIIIPQAGQSGEEGQNVK